MHQPNRLQKPLSAVYLPSAMKTVRNIAGHVFAVYAVLVFVATMVVVWVPVWLISLCKEPLRARLLHKVFRGWMSVYMPLVGCPVSRKGKEHFRKGERYVVVLNHNSLMDIPISTPWIPGANKTLAKVEMAKTPLFGVIYKAGSILVDRKKESSRRESFARMQETLDMGIHLCLYPEGTRNKSLEPLQPFFDGAFLTAIRTQRPILPGLIFNTGSVLPPGKKFWMLPKRVYIHFLQPIPTAGLTIADVGALKEKVRTLMESYYIANKNYPS